MNKKTTLSLALLTILFLSGYTATGTALNETWNVPNQERMTVASIGDPESVDPHWAYDTASAQLIINVYDTLIRFPRDIIPTDPYLYEPVISDSWLISGDGLTYRFHIRSNVAWHEAAYGAVTPRDVEWSFEAGMVMDHSGGPYWMFYEPLLGAYSSDEWNLADPVEAAALGQAIDDAIQVVDAAGIPTPAGEFVQFNLRMPYAPFTQILSQSGASIMDEEWGTAHGKFPGFDNTGYIDWRSYNDRYTPMMSSPLQIDAAGNFAPVMMGSGPYKFVTWIVEDYWELIKFDGYFMGWPAPHCSSYVSRVIVKLVPTWPTRRLLFLSNDPAAQADMVYVPRASLSEILFEPGVRGVKDLPMLALDSMHFTYDVSTTNKYFGVKPTLAGLTKLDLFSDIHMRKAFSYVLDFPRLMMDAFLGEAIQPATVVVPGLAFYNASKPRYIYDLEKARAHFSMAWGGIDANGDGDALDTGDTPGAAWTQGFTVPLTYNIGNAARKMAAELIEHAIETNIAGWGVVPEISVVGLPWGAVYVPAMTNAELSLFMAGWLADFTDPHNFVMPYLHTYGYFGYVQRVQYGQSNMVQKTWPWLSFTSSPGAPLNNTYVNLLIEEGMRQTDPAYREIVYNELMDINLAEIPTLPVMHPLARHWERKWVQGWYYNPLYGGSVAVGFESTAPADSVLYFYHMWKGIDADLNGDHVVDELDLIILQVHWHDPPFFIGDYDPIADIYPLTPDGKVNMLDRELMESQWGDRKIARTPVTIDIKPASYPNSINLDDQGQLPVAILGSATFNVETIHPHTLELGGAAISTQGSAKAPKIAYSIEDVNGDGFLDIIAFFRVQDLVAAGALTSTTTELELTGTLLDGTPIAGTDEVVVVPRT